MNLNTRKTISFDINYILILCFLSYVYESKILMNYFSKENNDKYFILDIKYEIFIIISYDKN